MNKSTKIALIVIAVLIMAGVFYYLTRNDSPKYNWNETFDNQGTQPYDLKLTYDLLAASRPKNAFVHVNSSLLNFLSTPDSSALYMFIGHDFYMDSVASIVMIDFVKRGNNAFISSTVSESFLLQILSNNQYPYSHYKFFQDSIIKIRVTPNFQEKDSTFKFDYRYGKFLKLHKWHGFESSFIEDTLATFGFEQLSNVKYALSDCFRIKCGEGWFIFHFNPILFTNYYMRQEAGFRYTNQLLSRYNKQKIYWDEASKSASGKSNMHESPLRFILSQKSLKWSWYLLCLFILLFVVFNAKRKQAYIPLLPSNRNTTIEYITSLATLHFQHNSLSYMADEILKQLLSFSKHKYGISPNLERKELIKVLAQRSGVTEESISNIFKRHSEVKYSPVIDTKDLMEFYKVTEYFYQNCK